MPAAIRVMHFSDTHFGYENYGRIDPETGLHTRLLDFRRTLTAAIELALEAGVRLAVFTGDAYRRSDPSQTQQREFAGCIRLLTDAGVPVVMLTGNHDVPGQRGRAHAVEIFRTLGVTGVTTIQRPEVIVVQTADRPVQIAAVPHLSKSFVMARADQQGKSPDEIREAMERQYSLYIAQLADDCDRALPTIFLGHFWVRNSVLPAGGTSYLSVTEPQVAVSDLVRPEVFDYVALGHIHRHQDLNHGARPPVVYAGSIDRVDFGERDERKGFVLLDLRKGATEYKFVDVAAARPMIEIEVDADNAEPTETILKALRGPDLKNAIVRLTYRISAENLALLREQEVRKALDAAFCVAGVRREVRQDRLTRTRVLTDSLDPTTALARYLEHIGKSEEQRSELTRYANVLFDQLHSEEALA